MPRNGRRKALVAAFLAGVALVGAGILLGLVVFPAAIKSRVIQSVQLSRGSDALQRYIRTPQPVLLKVYIFNVTNPEEVHAGLKPPWLRQLGPYVYDLYKEKFEVEEDFETDTLTYYQRNKYYFNRELSIGGEDDPVIVLNAPLLGIVEETAKGSPTMLPFVNLALPEMFTAPDNLTGNLPHPSKFTAFVETTVGKLLFHGIPIRCSRRSIFKGFIKSLVCSGLGANLPSSIKKTVEGDGNEEGDYLFSFLNHMNNSREGPMRVRRGLTDPAVVGQVVSWKDHTEMKAWGPPPPASSECNQVKGLDSSVFPPFMDENSVINVFQPEMCRSLSASFEKRVEFKGIQAMRYVADTNLFDSPERNPRNWCFYPSGDEASRDLYWSKIEYGVQDLSGCLGSQIIVSFPHFYSASRNYLNYSKGLRPRKEIHETFLDVETMTGTPLRAAKRLQFNMNLRRMSRINFLRNVSEGLFPILWAEEGLNLDDRFSKLLSESLFDVIRLLDVIKWSTIALGVLVITATLTASRGLWRLQSGDAEDKKMKEANQLPTYEMYKADGVAGLGDLNA